MEEIRCHSCNEVIEDGCEQTEINGKIYCQTCVDDNFEKCDDCGEYVLAGTLTETAEGNSVCDSCLSGGYTQCVECSEWTLDGNTNHIYNYGQVCDCCFDRDCFQECRDCGRYYHIDDMTYSDREEDWFCDSCYEDQNDIIGGYHDHHEGIPVFFGDNHDNSVPYLGIELEVDDGRNCTDCAIAVQDIIPTNFVYMEEDGSLCNGFEIITQPATLEYHLSIIDDYSKAFRAIVKNGFKSHDTSTCGLHVHFNRDFYQDGASTTEYELYVTRLLYLVEKFWTELAKFSRRKQHSLSRWAKRYSQTPEEIVKDMKRNRLDRYYAVNLSNDNTIEFRLFRGTLNRETFCATLELCHNLICAAKNTASVEEIQSISWESLLTTDTLKSYWDRVKDRSIS